MHYEIICQPSFSLLEVTLKPGERIVAEAGAMAWMEGPLKTETSTRGGVLSGLKRAVLSGESFFQNTYSAEGGPAKVALASGVAGDIVPYPMSGGELFLERGATWPPPKEYSATANSRDLKACSARGCSRCVSREPGRCFSLLTEPSKRFRCRAPTRSITALPWPGSRRCNTRSLSAPHPLVPLFRSVA